MVVGQGCKVLSHLLHIKALPRIMLGPHLHACKHTHRNGPGGLGSGCVVMGLMSAEVYASGVLDMGFRGAGHGVQGFRGEG